MLNCYRGFRILHDEKLLMTIHDMTNKYPIKLSDN